MFVLDLPAGHSAGRSVVAAGEVGTRVVRTTGSRLGRGASRSHVAVAKREEVLPSPFERRLEPVADQPPDVIDGAVAWGHARTSLGGVPDTCRPARMEPLKWMRMSALSAAAKKHQTETKVRAETR